MHMLEAGINIVYIRDFLGHEDISTTMVYVRADNRLKNDAINALAPKVTDEMSLPDWNKDRDLHVETGFDPAPDKNKIGKHVERKRRI